MKWLKKLGKIIYSFLSFNLLYKDLNEDSRYKIYKKNNLDNVKRIMLISSILIIVQISNIIVDGLNNVYEENIQLLYTVGAIILLSLGIISVIVSILLLKKPDKNYTLIKIFTSIFYLLFITGFLIFCYGDIINGCTNQNIYVLYLTLVVIPIFSMWEIVICYTIIVLSLTIFMVVANAPVTFFQQTYIISLTMICATILLEHYRLNSIIGIEKVKTLNQELYIKSTTDHLTQLKNRFGLQDIIDQKIRVNNTNEIRTLGIFIIDIDFFKQYNDKFLHTQGDVVLKKIAEVINQSIDIDKDIAVRWGGEEFLVFLDNYDKEKLLQLGQDIKNNVENLKIIAGTQIISKYVTISMGISEFKSEELDNYAKYIGLADKQLYYAKEAGRNRIAFDNEVTK